MYTFSYRDAFALHWENSSRKFETIKLAANAASEWLAISARNNSYISVRLVDLASPNVY